MNIFWKLLEKFKKLLLKNLYCLNNDKNLYMKDSWNYIKLNF